MRDEGFTGSYPERLMRVPAPVLATAAFAAAVAALTFVLAPRLLPGLRAPASGPAVTRPSLRLLTAWVAGGPLADEDLEGRPALFVLVDDTDPAAEPALLAAERWHLAFAPHARIVAVHVPRYAFAADTAVAGRLARRLSLTLPVASDAGLRLSAALAARRDAPAFALFDADGRALAGGGADLAGLELSLRESLAAADPPVTPTPFMPLPPLPASRRLELGAGLVVAGPLAGRRAGEEPFFSAQFRYQEQGRPGIPQPVGPWRVGADGITALRGGAAQFVAIRYSAGRVGVVLSPPPQGESRVWVLRDEAWPAEAVRGRDLTTDATGAVFVEVREPRLFWIDRGGGERTLKLSPERPGVTLHAFVESDADESR